MIASKVMASARRVDFLVIGAGVAGLRAAVELADHGRVLVVTKEAVAESNTNYAQGGIAVAMAADDDASLHLADTLAAGDGLVHQQAAAVLVAEGPMRVEELIAWGARFDREGSVLTRTREGAHSRARILHANGDATGAEISRSLAEFARAHRNLEFAERTTMTGLVVGDGRVAGADFLDRDDYAERILARCVLIAAGGAGQVYSNTTNPAVATGDGLAQAGRAGAALADMEFYQFHPTAFSFPGAPRFLLSEALRGEGAYLRNDRGERFMERYHPLLELAPRDVVARAITREGMGERPGETREVDLDMRHVRGLDLHRRFPRISAFLAQYGLDLHRDLIPVRPAAHYLMGGIRTDVNGRTSLQGLYAAGEAACTGVHGANRLASNSLLEGLVFGSRGAKAMLEDGLMPAEHVDGPRPAHATLDEQGKQRVEAVIAALQVAMWTHAGLLRDKTSLLEGLLAQAECEGALAQIAATGKTSRRLVEAQSLCSVGHAILSSALAREESRGAHFRTDFPARDDVRFKKHSVSCREGTGEARIAFETW
jgi:L-aspartate oxidase